MTKPTIYGFFSAKGGTGKTAVMTAFAFALARRGHKVAVVDADFTGTSIADGLALQAPDGAGGLLSRAETLRRRLAPNGDGLPFLDGAMAPEGPTFEPQAWAWRHDEAPEIAWYPSSPLMAHHARVREHVLAPDTDTVQGRLAGLLAKLGAAEDGEARTVLVDMGPGLVGLPGALAKAAVTLAAPYTALLVSTPDKNDLLRSVEIAKRLIAADQPVRWLLNRNEDAPVEAVREELRALVGGGKRHGIWTVLEGFGAHERLRGLYRRDRIGFTDGELDRFADLLLHGGL